MRQVLLPAFVMLSLFVCVQLSHGQDSGFFMRTRTGVNISELKTSDNNIKSEFGLGAGVSLNFDYTFRNNLYLESGLGISYKTGKLKSDSQLWTGKNERELKSAFLQLPVQLGYKINLSDIDPVAFRPAVGLYLAYNVTGTDIPGLNDWDKGLLLTLGFSFNKAVLDLGYEYGFKSNNFSRNTFFLTLGYTL